MIGSVSGISASPSLALPKTGLGGSAGAQATQGTSFEAMLKDVATSTIDAVKGAEQASVLGIRGEMPTQDVVRAVMSAEQSLQTAVAIRDKVVAAYLDLTRMQI